MPSGASAEGMGVVERETRVVSNHPWVDGSPGAQTKLLMQVTLRMRDGSELDIRALVDTGSEVNLVRRGLVPYHLFRASARPKRFVTASHAVLEGGTEEVPCDLIMAGVDVDTRQKAEVVCPIAFYDADIRADALLSYEWLRQHNVDVRCRRHGLEVNQPGGPIWVAGLDSKAPRIGTTRGVCRVSGQKRPYEPVGKGAQSGEEYTVRGPFFEEIVQRLGARPQRDCFATEANKRCERWYSQGDNALSKVWGEDEVLWMNPPWSLWPEVAKKISESRCEVVCVCPAWSKEWVQQVVGMASKRIYFEKGVRMFEVDGRPAPNTLWGVWALRIKAGPRKTCDKEAVIRDCVFEPRWRPMRAMGVTEGPAEVAKVQQAESRAVGRTQQGSRGRVLDLFSGTGSVSRAFEDMGYEVVSVDSDPQTGATHREDVLEWRYQDAYPVGAFDVVFSSPPCDQYSRAKVRGTRDLARADRMVQKALEIVRYFQPRRWFLENPRYGLLRERPYMKDLPWVDVDYCQFAEWGYQKPTRIWGGEHVKCLEPRLCDLSTCPNVVVRPSGKKGHREPLGGNHMTVTRKEKYRVPAPLIWYLMSEPEDAAVQEVQAELREVQAGLASMQLAALPGVPPPSRGAGERGPERPVH